MKKYRLIQKGKWNVIQKRTKLNWWQKIFNPDKNYEWKDFAKSTESKLIGEEFFNRYYRDLEI